MKTETRSEIVKRQVSAAKDEFRTWGRVNPATISSWDSVEYWESLMKRHERFIHYILAIKPEWKLVKRIGYADNSIEATYISKDGILNTCMEVFPSGDAS